MNITTIGTTRPAIVTKMPLRDLHAQMHGEAHAGALDADTTKFINILHQGSTERFIQRLHANKDGSGRETKWFRSDEPIIVPPHWYNAGHIYFGVNGTTVRVTDADRAKKWAHGKTDQAIEKYTASKNDTIAAANCLFAEFDGKDETNPTLDEIAAQVPIVKAADVDRCKNDPKARPHSELALQNQAVGSAKLAKFKTNPAHYNALAAARVGALDPAPSVIVFSGGGWHCYWLLSETFVITSETDRKRLADVQARWVARVGGDSGAKDIRHILRLIGFLNRKSAYAPDYPLVTFVQKDFELRYTFTELATLLPESTPDAPHTTKRTTRTQRTAQPHTDGQETDPALAIANSHTLIGWFNRTVKIREILAHFGYSDEGDRMSRPGEPESKGVEFFADENKSRHWSSNDELCSVYKRSAFDVWCHYTFAGNKGAAVQALADYVYLTLRFWAQNTSFEPYIPDEVRSPNGIHRTASSEARTLDSILDVMEKTRTFSVEMSKRRGGRQAGVGPNTWLSAVKRLAYVVTCTVTDHGTYLLTLTPECYRLAQMDHLILAKDMWQITGDPFARDGANGSALNTYSPNKAKDPFLVGTSRTMKKEIAWMAENDPEIQVEIQASFAEYQSELDNGAAAESIVPPLDGYDLAKEKYTYAQPGETGLLVLTTLGRCGAMTGAELATETGRKPSSIWRACRKLVNIGLLDTECAMFAPTIYHLADNAGERLHNIAPSLRTYRLSNERLEKDLLHAQKWLLRGYAEAVKVKDKEQEDRVERRFMKAAKRRMGNLKNLNPTMTEEELEAKYQVYGMLKSANFATADTTDPAAFERNQRTPEAAQAVNELRTNQITEHRDTVRLIADLVAETLDAGVTKDDVLATVMKYDFDVSLVRSVLGSQRLLEHSTMKIGGETLARNIASYKLAGTSKRDAIRELQIAGFMPAEIDRAWAVQA